VSELIRVAVGEGDDAAISAAVGVLAAGGVVAYPTETFYALGVSVFDTSACRRLFALKGRPASKTLPAILAGIVQLELVASEISPEVRRLAERFWPGPLTLVIPARASVAAASEGGTLAVRVSGLALARELAEAFGPLTSTSANRSGEPAPTTAGEVFTRFAAGEGEGINLVLDGGSTPGGPPSTIVDVSAGVPRLVREGRIPFQEVLEFYRRDQTS